MFRLLIALALVATASAAAILGCAAVSYPAPVSTACADESMSYPARTSSDVTTVADGNTYIVTTASCTATCTPITAGTVATTCPASATCMVGITCSGGSTSTVITTTSHSSNITAASSGIAEVVVPVNLTAVEQELTAHEGTDELTNKAGDGTAIDGTATGGAGAHKISTFAVMFSLIAAFYQL
jgi:hypothetical protein